jgi:hypothetical protein
MQDSLKTKYSSPDSAGKLALGPHFLIQQNGRAKIHMELSHFTIDLQYLSQDKEWIPAKAAVLLSVIVCIGGYVGAMLPLFFAPRRFLLVLFGFMMGGYVYGCYGMLIGAIFKRELEGILFIVLLANFDVGWLQNPIYYAQAQNKAIIRHLPGFFPSQLSMVSAFTDHSVLQPLLGSLAYGTLLLMGAMLIFWWKMRIRK